MVLRKKKFFFRPKMVMGRVAKFFLNQNMKRVTKSNVLWDASPDVFFFFKKKKFFELKIS